MTANQQPATTAERESDEQASERLGAELEAELSPAQWHKVRQYADRAGDVRAGQADDFYDRRAEDLAGHFPAFAPAIRLAWRHVLEPRLPEAGRCCGQAED